MDTKDIFPDGAYFVTGIDTDAGKTYITGRIARDILRDGRSVITQKFIQTGCRHSSEDIVRHRMIMGCGLLQEDIEGVTAPLIFGHPCSAQLAARIDGRDIDSAVIDNSTRLLREHHDVVLVEGAGGLMTPITDDFFTIDYVATRRLPLVLVTNGVLGSINHTVLTLEAVKARGIELHAVIYNTYFDTDRLISADTCGFVERYLAKHFPHTAYLVM